MAVFVSRNESSDRLLGLSDDSSNVPLETLDDLYNHAEGIRERVSRILSPPEPLRAEDGDNGASV